MKESRSITELISELTYQSYVFNRKHSPHITPKQWKVIYGADADAMETKYQQTMLK